MVDKIRIEISSSDDVKVGSGPIYSSSRLRIIKTLDGAGNITASFSGTEKRANELITNEKRARCYVVNNEGVNRYIGSGVLRNISIVSRGNSWELSASGPDLFDTLKRYNLLLRREYRALTIKEVLEDILSIAGWTVVVDEEISNSLITVRFDGESILKALQILATNYGLHFREGSKDKEIEFGKFGKDTDLVITSPKMTTVGVYKNKTVAVVNRISVERSTQELVNWVIPIGGGEGLAALTLKESTRSEPYPVQTMVGPDGQVIYFISDNESINELGISQKPLLFKDITPIDNTTTGIVRAANALYDAAVAYLSRYSKKLETYKLSLNKLDVTIKPGDKVRLVYNGLIYDQNNKPIDFLSINQMLWVIKITEGFSRSNSNVELEVATIDRYEEDAATIIIGTLEAVSLRNLRIQPYPTTSSFVYGREIDNTHSASIPVNITNGILYLDRCRVRFKTRSFRATAMAAGSIPAVVGTTGSAAAVVGTSASGGGIATSTASGGGATSSAGGSHNHRMFVETSIVGFGSPSDRPYYGRDQDGGNLLGVRLATTAGDRDLWTEQSSGNHTHTIPAHQHSITVGGHTHDITIPSHSHDITIPGHTHDIQYGIVDDTFTPDTVRVFINGVDRTSALGGPWGVGGGVVDRTIEIGDYLNDAIGGLRQEHTVEFKCDSGQGEVEVTIELKVTVQSLQQV